MSKNSHGGGGVIWGSLGPFGRFEKDQNVLAGRSHAIESLCKIRKRVIGQFLRNHLLSEKLTDDGQLGQNGQHGRRSTPQPNGSRAKIVIFVDIVL